MNEIKKPAIRLIVHALQAATPRIDTIEARERHKQALEYAEAILASMTEDKSKN